MMQVSPSCCYFHPLSTKYLLQHLVVEHLPPVCKITVPFIILLCFYMANGKVKDSGVNSKSSNIVLSR
jgi:hypothetical protein